MTDLETMRAMLERAGVQYTQYDYATHPTAPPNKVLAVHESVAIELIFKPDGSLLKVDGYN